MQRLHDEIQLRATLPTKQDPTDDTHATRRMRATYRLRGIHESFDRALLESALSTFFDIEKDELTIHSLAYDAAYSRSSRQKVATITFETTPGTLGAGFEWQLRIPLPGDESQKLQDVFLDTTFEGFTPLTPVEQEKDTTIDCILIHGWAGHPVGSFSSYDGNWFWPRDGLCYDIPAFCVWLYGYSSNLQDSSSIADVHDHADTFRRALVDSLRLHDMAASRPLVYIVHSLGGWVLQDTIIEMSVSKNPDDKLILEKTRGALLFGVPMLGMEVGELRNFVHEDDLPATYTANLLDKRYGFRQRTKQADEFYDTCIKNKALMYAFHETQKTPTDSTTQRWVRNGPEALLVEPSSATYGCLERQNKIPWRSNHVNMLKLRKGDIRYQALLNRLWEVQRLEKDQTVHATNADLSFNELIREADRLMHDHYRSGDRLLIKRLSGEELELEKCYINLALKDRKEEYEEQTTSFSLEARLQLGASNVSQSISLENLFQSRKLADGKTVIPKRIFIQGRAGIGKTTLCKKIVYEFLEGRLGTTLFDRLVWIPLRGLKSSQDEYGWQELLQDTFRITNHRWKEVKASYRKQFDNPVFLSRTLFLFDGLDEISYGWNYEVPMYDFLDTILRGVPNIIITSRPQANTFSIERFDLDLETTGFTIDQVGLYIRNCVKDREVVAKMEELLDEKPLVRDLLRIPIQLDAFCYIWPDEDCLDTGSSGESEQESSAAAFSTGSSTTMMMLYQSLVIELCKKDLKLLKGMNRQLRPGTSEVQARFKGELTLLEQLAFQGMLNNVVEFSPKHWNRLANYFYESSKEFSDLLSSTFERLSFLRTSDYREDNARRSYHFIHLTFQEFFAARHFTDCWQHDKPLISLQLDHLVGHKSEKMPFRFLQEEKYNPRYNIFWRFVAGLVQQRTKHDERTSQDKSIHTFFKNLHDKPRDLFGNAHHRLLMYCLSEVVMQKTEDIQELRERQERILRQRILAEYSLSKSILLGVETEFPEGILLSLLCRGDDNLNRAVYSALLARPSISAKTLHATFHFLIDKNVEDLDLDANMLVFRNSRNASQQMMAQAVQNTCSTLSNKDSPVQQRAPYVLARSTSLPKQVISTLLAQLKNKNENDRVRSSAAFVLRKQSSLSEQVIDALLPLIKDKDDVGLIRRRTAVILECQSCLPEEAVNTLLALLTDEDYELQRTALRTLSQQPSMSRRTTDALFVLLKNNDNEVRSAAIHALRGQSPLSGQTVDVLLALLKNKDECVFVRRAARGTLAAQSPLFNQTINPLPALLKENDSDARISALHSLQQQSSLPEQFIDALLALIKEKDSYARILAALVLGKYSSLPRQAIGALLALLKNKAEDQELRRGIVSILRQQSCLPEQCINALLILLNDEDEDKDMQRDVAYAIGMQSSLTKPAFDAILVLLNSVDHRAYQVLQRRVFLYSMIKDLEIEPWQRLWSIWLYRSAYIHESCFELNGSLFLWSNGIKHKITDQEVQTQRLLELVQNVKAGDVDFSASELLSYRYPFLASSCLAYLESHHDCGTVTLTKTDFEVLSMLVYTISFRCEYLKVSEKNGIGGGDWKQNSANHRAKVNATSDRSGTLLHIASIKGHKRNVESLTGAGTDVNTKMGRRMMHH